MSAESAHLSTFGAETETKPKFGRPLAWCWYCGQELGLAVVGSQIVGLVPLKAMIQAAEYYALRENLFLLEEDQKIRLVVDRLGLHSVGAFNPKERVIE